MNTPEPTRRRLLTLLVLASGHSALPALGVGGSDDPPATLRQLYLAIEAANPNAVRALVESAPGLLRETDGLGRRPLVHAFFADRPAMVELLVELGAPLDLAESALVGDWDRFEELATALGNGVVEAVNRPHPIGGTALWAAARAGHHRTMWRASQYGADPNRRAGSGTSPARAAIDLESEERAEATLAALLGNGADVNTPQPAGDSVLHAAARRGSTTLVRLALRKDADVSARDASGATPRDVAHRAGHQTVVELLDQHRRVIRDHSTSRYAYRADGEPYRAPAPAEGPADRLLHNSVVGSAHFDLDATREHLASDARLAHAVSSSAEAAVEACAHTGRRSIVELLLEGGAPYSICTATLRGDASWVERLLDEDPLRCHERGPHDFALLWYTAIGGATPAHLEILERLLEAGAPVDQGYLGTTTLHFAVRAKQYELVELLVRRGADPETPGRKFPGPGSSALDLARELGDRRSLELLELLGG